VKGKLLNHIGGLLEIFFGFFWAKIFGLKKSSSLSHLPKQNISPF